MSSRQETFGPYKVTYQTNKLTIELQPEEKSSEIYSWLSEHFKDLEVKVEEKGLEFISKEILEYLKKKEEKSFVHTN